MDLAPTGIRSLRVVALYIILFYAFFFAVALSEAPGCAEPDGYGISAADAATFEAVVFPDVPEPPCPEHKDYYYCPPFDEIWQVVVTLDCNGVVLSVSECEQVFDCDPSDPLISVQPCTDEDGYPGEMNIYCDKGVIKEGDCESPCTEEVCNYIDDDCDGEIDEGQTNPCGYCGMVPQEECNGLDDDCDGLTDESLLQNCSTACGAGFEICVGGQYVACNAPKPLKEACNGKDDDCDGLVDEDLDCGCEPEDIGVLIPCMDKPLLCGEGYKTCLCSNEDCTETEMTECKAACVYIGPTPCDPLWGVALPEVCNNYDDDCDEEIDEDLALACYTGPPGTEDVGICHGGESICIQGHWGAYNNGAFVPGLCAGEVLPAAEEICNGVDDTCDGIKEDPLEPTDFAFIIDWSGSMKEEVDAVVKALKIFSAHYADEDVIQWSLIAGTTPNNSQCTKVTCDNPTHVCYEGVCYDCGDLATMLDACNFYSPGEPCYEAICPVLTSAGGTEVLKRVTDLVSFTTFYTSLEVASVAIPLIGGQETLLDAMYLSLHTLAPPSAWYLPSAQLSWDYPSTSEPAISEFSLQWREDSNKVVITFSDEVAQSYLIPSVTVGDIKAVVAGVEDFSFYAFSTPQTQLSQINGVGWSEVAAELSGTWYQMTMSAGQIYSDLMTILDDTACE